MKWGPYGLEGLGGSLPSLQGPLGLSATALGGSGLQQNALANYYGPDYECYQAELKRQAWRASVSQNWLNAMLDVELGTYP